jgi:hypothetical protein
MKVGAGAEPSLESVLMLADIAHSLNEFRPLSETLNKVCERVATIGGYDFASLFMCDEPARHLVIRGSWKLNPAYVKHVNSRHLLPLEAHDQALVPPTVEAYLTGKPTAVEDVEQDPRFGWRTGARLQGYRSCACVPVIVRAQVRGVLNCYVREAHQYSHEEFDLLQLMSRLAGVAIETAQLADLQRQTERELRDLSHRLRDQNGQLARLIAVQARLVEDLARPGVSTVERAAQTLAEMTGCAVLVSGETGSTLAYIGPSDVRAEMALISARPDIALRLRQQPLLTVDGCSCARIGVDEAGFGMIVLRPALDDYSNISALATQYAAIVLAADRQGERAGSSLQDHAAPAVLLALIHGLYTRMHTMEVAAAFGIAADSELRVVLLRCPTPESAYRLSRRRERLGADGWPLVAAAADGHDCVLLVHEATRPELERTALETRAHHGEIVCVGASGALPGLFDLPTGYQQALTAAATAAGSSAPLTAFEDLGSYGDLICDLPAGRAHSLVDRVLGPLQVYDSRHRTRLIATLAEYVRKSGGLLETATALNVQPRTVRHRLRRCAELSGLDLNDYASLGEVVIALRFDEILGRREKQGQLLRT